jgi:hypothetical protein
MSAPSLQDELSRQRFVVRPAGEVQDSLPDLGDIGSVERLPSPRVGWVVCLHTPAGSARKGWQVLQHRLGDVFLVAPVMDDAHGAERYPTGLVAVRFGAPVSDARMQAFAREHGLALVRRAKFTKVQALFRPADICGRFLPDIPVQLSASPDADAAWLDAESAYTRSA